MSQPGVPKQQSSFISTKNETELVANVHDPSGFLRSATNVSYVWSRNNSVVANTTEPSLKMNFTQEGVYPLQVDLTANFNASEFTGVKKGSFNTTVFAKGESRVFIQFL